MRVTRTSQPYVPASLESIDQNKVRLVGALPHHRVWRALEDVIDRWSGTTALRNAAILMTLINILGNVVWALHRAGELQDLGSFLHSGASYRLGVNPYAYHYWVFPQPISVDALNLNPPISLYAFEFFTTISTTLVKYSLFGATALIFALAVWALVRAYPEKRDVLVVLLTFGMAGLWHMLGYFQIYAPLIAAMVGSWLCMRRGNLLMAGILLGAIAAIKPNFVLLPLLIAVAGHRQAGLTALATAAAISAVPLAIDGPTVYREWLDLSLSFDGLEWASNASLASVGARFGLPLAGEFLGVALVVAVGYWLWRRRPDIQQTTTLSLITVLLFGPVSWAGYTLFLLPVLYSRPWNRGIWIAVLLLNVPFWLVREAALLTPVANVSAGAIYAWALVLLLALVLYEGAREARPPARSDHVRGRPHRRPPRLSPVAVDAGS